MTLLGLGGQDEMLVVQPLQLGSDLLLQRGAAFRGSKPKHCALKFWLDGAPSAKAWRIWHSSQRAPSPLALQQRHATVQHNRRKRNRDLQPGGY